LAQFKHRPQRASTTFPTFFPLFFQWFGAIHPCLVMWFSMFATWASTLFNIFLRLFAGFFCDEGAGFLAKNRDISTRIRPGNRSMQTRGTAAAESREDSPARRYGAPSGRWRIENGEIPEGGIADLPKKAAPSPALPERCPTSVAILRYEHHLKPKKSGAEATALRTLARVRGVSTFREAHGVRRVHRRFRTRDTAWNKYKLPFYPRLPSRRCRFATALQSRSATLRLAGWWG